jgi:hypothetical protein
LDLFEVALQKDLIKKDKGDAYVFNYPLICDSNQIWTMEDAINFLKRDNIYDQLLLGIYRKEKIIFHMK